MFIAGERSVIGNKPHVCLNKHMYIPYLLIVLAAIGCYWNGLALFFAADDFLWLERAKYAPAGNWYDVFKVEGHGLYLSPLVHIIFRVNYMLSGINPLSYHLFDLLVHSINALLVSYLSFRLFGNQVAAFFSGLIFAVTPANADSVLWPSDRVDTFAALFYLLAIISYLFYHSKAKIYQLIPITLFVMSLSAKSTPVILPIVILSFEILYFRCRKYGEIAMRVLPFLLISTMYVAILFYMSPKASATISVTTGLNWKEFFRSIAVLFFPEYVIASNELLFFIFSWVLFIVSVLVSMYFISFEAISIAFILIVIIISPLLLLNVTYVYATHSSPYYFVLGSICHRLYFAVIGFSFLMGGALSSILKSITHRVSLHSMINCLFALLIFIYGFTYIAQREQIWLNYYGEYLAFAEGAKNIASVNNGLSNSSKMYIINSPVKGYTQSMWRIYLNNNRLNSEDTAHFTLIPDITSSKEPTSVLAWNNTQRKLVDVTREILSYQTKVKLCPTLENGRGREGCFRELSKLAVSINATYI